MIEAMFMIDGTHFPVLVDIRVVEVVDVGIQKNHSRLFVATVAAKKSALADAALVGLQRVSKYFLLPCGCCLPRDVC